MTHDQVLISFERLPADLQADILCKSLSKLRRAASSVSNRAAKVLVLMARYDLTQRDVAEVLAVDDAQITRALERARTVLIEEALAAGARPSTTPATLTQVTSGLTSQPFRALGSRR